MHKTLLIFVALLSAVISRAQTNDLLPNQLIVSQPIFSFQEKNKDIGAQFEHFHVLENTQHTDTFIGIHFIKKALEGSVPIYNWTYSPFGFINNENMTADELLEKISYTVNSQNPYTEHYKTNKPNFDEIKYLYFIEEWHFDAEKFSFEKKVLALGPIREYFRTFNDTISDKRLQISCQLRPPAELNFWAKRRSDKRMIHTNTIAYECLLTSTEPQVNYHEQIFEVKHAPFLNSHSRLKLFETIFKQVTAGERTAFSYPDNKQMTTSEIEKALGMDYEHVRMVDSETGQAVELLMQSTIINYEEFKSLIFFEEWYYDPKTLRVKKEVIALAPVKHYFSDSDLERENPLKKIVFKIYLK